MQPCILSIDQGTTSTRVIAFDKQNRAIASHQQEITQFYPKPGWVEHDGEEIWQTTLTCLKSVISQSETLGFTPIAIGITNQRETTLVWSKETGTLAHKAIVWQDRRTTNICDHLRSNGFDDAGIKQRTGLLCDPYFSGTKLSWILQHIDQPADNLLFGTVETFLLWRLTNGKTHKTDISNASRTMLFNIHTQDWDDDLLNILKIPHNMMPQVVDNNGDIGMADIDGMQIPITGMAGDQQAASFGQACFHAGMLKSTYGTGCFALLNCGDTLPVSNNRLLSTVAWRLGGKTTYALEGSIFMAGAAIQWLRDGLQIITRASETEAMAQSLTDNGGVVMVPAFTGLGAPHWNPDVRGAFFGLTRDSNTAHMARATLEAVVFQTYDLLTAMQADSGQKFTNLRIDGGLSNNNWFAQTLADYNQLLVDRPANTETTALGAAWLAGLHIGLYDNQESLAASWQANKQFNAAAFSDIHQTNLDRWKRAVDCVKAFG